MVVIFATIVIDPDRRSELIAEVMNWLERTADERSEASIYEFFPSPGDPSRLHFFQSWPEDDAFDRWNASAAHQASVFRRPGTALDAWAVRFDGCTTATEIRPPAEPSARE